MLICFEHVTNDSDPQCSGRAASPAGGVIGHGGYVSLRLPAQRGSADPSSTCICRFSRWTKRVHPCPPSGTDPAGYLRLIRTLVSRGNFDVLLPTHEQAWLFAVAGDSLDARLPTAVASARSFSRVQSKLEFARLLDEVGLPQPAWEVIDSPKALTGRLTPFYLKTPYSTAGSGVRRISVNGGWGGW